MKSLSFVLCLLSFGLLADEITGEKFPDADAVTVDEIERVKYNPDGTYEQTAECWTKILTEKGRREESSLTLDYSKRYGEAAIVFVGIVGTNGVERTIDVSATLKEQTDNSSMNANIYDPLDRKIVCTVPGLKIGETLHVKTRRKTVKPRCRDKWADLSVMEWSHPIVKSTYEVTAPASRPLKKIAIRHPLGNVITNVTKRADGSLVHTFVATNSAQVFPEPDMPPLYTQVQNVRVSTAEDWPEISKWYWELCAPHLAKTNAAMVAKVSELTKEEGSEKREQGTGNRDRVMRRIFKFVSQEVRYMGLTMEDTSPGYAPHDVDVTFDNRYGVCRDKAGLLVAMLRLADFKAFPVLIHVGAKLDPEVPQPFFNHAIVAVEIGVEHRSRSTEDGSTNHCRPTPSTSTYLLMDPTNENTKDLFPAYLGNRSYLVARPEGEELKTSPVESPEKNGVVIASNGTLAQDGSLSMISRIRLNGINDTAYRQALVRRKPADRVKLFEKIVKAVSSGAELVKCTVRPVEMRDTEVPIEIELVTRFPESVMHGTTRHALTVPFLGKTLGLVNFLLHGNTSLEKRKYPLLIDSTARVTEDVELDLSGAALGPALELSSAEKGTLADYGYTRTFSLTNGLLTAHREQTIGTVEFSPEAYAALREEIKRTEAAERKNPVFAADPVAEADVRILLDSSETTILSDRAWVTTNTVVKEVLTYDGKKRSAELKIAFNPAVERLGVLSAVVCNADGRTSSISEREQNLMDCDWAAAAPRYPASKTLVISLPSVEIGSVISYQYVRVVTNAPASFYAAYTFDSHEPLERKFVRVNDWRREVVRPRRLPNEPNQPSASFWRDHVIVSSNCFEAVDLDIRPVSCSLIPVPCSLRAVRDWMAKYVKVAGPSLYEVPLDAQLTDPEVVLKERYATRLDYVRTLCALLRGAGFDANVVFAAADAGEPESVRRRIMFEKPNVRAFSAALCRVKVREGGFFGFGGTEKVYFLGTENQYAPIGPTAYEGCDYFDPETGTFGVVTVPQEDFVDGEEERSDYVIRENGAIDLTVEHLIFGSGVGAFRKTYAEILPEDRSRRYQALLGSVAQAAKPTSELKTDVESYPARQKFSCFIPDYATVQGKTITIQIPELVSSLPTLVGSARQTPFALSAVDDEVETVTIHFPKGYTEIESIPKPFVLTNPLNPSEIWLENTVSSKIENEMLTVTLSRKSHKHNYLYFNQSFYELIKDWSRLATSRKSRTIVVRRCR